ncbi:MAG: Na+/H+ antiporter [Chloroflexota bacterium]
MSDFILIEEIIIGLLLIASIVAITARRLRLPYTVGLVLIGLALTLIRGAEVDISPNVILALLIPPLVFEVAFHIRFEDLRQDFWLILLLAIPGVVITTLMVAGLVSFGTELSFGIAAVFGSLVAATDPVAVVALFRRLGVPKRLQVLLEGESLFNDGTAIVMFSITVAAVSSGEFHLVEGIAEFLKVAGGGVLVGIILGMIISQIIGRIDDPLVETTLTTVLAFGAYLVAELPLFEFSGVLAVVAAGIVNGNAGPRGMSPTTRVVVFNFWEYAAFIANSLIFLLVGLTIDLYILLDNWQAILWAILAVLAARAVSIYGFSMFGRQIPGRWRHVLYWGGLRGAIALALVLSLPAGFEGREVLQAMAFGVVLFTLLVQGFSMDWLVARLKLVNRSHVQEEYERRHARFIAGRASLEYLRRMGQQGLISEHTWQRLLPLMERQTETLAEAVRDVISTDPTMEAEELDTARREALRAQRSALTGLLRDGVISEEVYAQLVGEVDAALTEHSLTWPELLRSGSVLTLDAKHMVMAMVQEQDVENAISALGKVGFSVARLSSTGGFLSRRNVTLFIGLPEGREETVVKVLQSSCRKRVDFGSSPIQNWPIPLAAGKQVTVGGATIFIFEVETYDEF